MTRTYNRPSVEQQAKVFVLLNEHCSSDEEGYAVYADGWSDEKVAKAAGVTTQSVGHRRHALYGRLKYVSKDGASSLYVLNQEVNKLKERIDILEELISSS